MITVDIQRRLLLQIFSLPVLTLEAYVTCAVYNRNLIGFSDF